MPASQSQMVLGRVAVGIAGLVGLYGILLGVLLQPSVQRLVNTLFRDDLNDPEAFGFSYRQVTPFNLHTPDGETLYAWHVLPLDAYSRNEKRLRAGERPREPADDFTKTTAFELLQSDGPIPPRAVVWFHGNAGHIAQQWRPHILRYLATQPNTHVFTIDYRGFGLSSGSPTEAGLITDGTTLVDFILSTCGVPPERIVVIGQSLGTAVASAIGLHFADPSSELIPSESREMTASSLVKQGMRVPTTFAGVILVAPFSSIPALLLTYRLGGFLPVLLPFRPFPGLADYLTSQMVDKWLSAERLTAYYHALEGSPRLHAGSRNMGSLQLIHALNDRDIPYHQTEMICRRMFGQRDEKSEVDKAEIDATECINGTAGTGVVDVNREGWPRVRFEIVGYGGHNRIVTFSPVSVAVVRAMEDLFDQI